MSDTRYSNLQKELNNKKTPAQSPIKGLDNTLLNFYKAKEPIDKKANFDTNYEDAPTLLGGDKPLVEKKDLTSISIRKTTTPGLYKVVISKNHQVPEIKMLDETELFNSCIKGTISKLSTDKYEITYFDDEGDVVIEQLNKDDCIEFLEKHNLTI